ncbi:MAG TPA: N-acetylglucosamine-6-phosphate deacetylase [Blastocatellia bacterium]|nr:N-acetylglucosamine-6-phosphate deacetylase [Blastocatellia bacterium]
MNQLLLHNARVIREDGIQHGGLMVRDGRIAEIFEHTQTPTGISSGESIDLGEGLLAPGLIDIHIHGSAGIDVQNTDNDGLSTLSEFLLKEGVTGYFTTLVPTEEQRYRSAISTVQSRIQAQVLSKGGARILGIHFEGPFVSHNKCGALQPGHFRTYDGDPRSINTFVGLDGIPTLRSLMTVAPEVTGGIDLTRELTRRGLRVFVGHTQAEPSTLDLAFEAGARHMTHFPNALDPLHHRKPGAVAWGLLGEEVTMDCIADLCHVDPLMLRLIYRSKSASRMALISDAIQPAGLGDGDYTVWGTRIAVRDGVTAVGEGPSKGALAGSVITLRQAMKNMISIGVPVHEAVKMASLTPARAAGVDSEIGSVETGKRADLISLDEEFDVGLAISAGEVLLRD